jgi:hypothetical protein
MIGWGGGCGCRDIIDAMLGGMLVLSSLDHKCEGDREVVRSEWRCRTVEREGCNEGQSRC